MVSVRVMDWSSTHRSITEDRRKPQCKVHDNFHMYRRSKILLLPKNCYWLVLSWWRHGLSTNSCFIQWQTSKSSTLTALLITTRSASICLNRRKVCLSIRVVKLKWNFHNLQLRRMMDRWIINRWLFWSQLTAELNLCRAKDVRTKPSTLILDTARVIFRTLTY